jgi:Domain of unknown function (DUF4168)
MDLPAIFSLVWTSGQRWMLPRGLDRLALITLIGLLLLGRPTESLAAVMNQSSAPTPLAAPVVFDQSRRAAIGESARIGTSKPNIDNISAEKIDQFVHAYQQVLALVQRRQGELQAAETESLEKGLKREIEATAMGLIEQTGLTRQEYFQLLSLASVDSELGDNIATLLQESSR